MCDDADHEELLDLSCVDSTINGGLIGFGAGLSASIVLSTVLVVGSRARRKSEAEPR